MFRQQHGISSTIKCLCGAGSTKEGADIVRFVGDQVAIVLAETGASWRSHGLIELEWQDLPVLMDSEEAARPWQVG
jgi:hypothetical protein